MSAARQVRRCFVACALIVACGALTWGEFPPLAADDDAGPTIHEVKSGDGQTIAIEAGPFLPRALAAISKEAEAAERWARVLQVSVDDTTAGTTAIAGSYTVSERSLRFTPRYPFRAGDAYRVVLRPAEMDSTGSTSGEVIYRFRLPAPVARPAEVTAIYPSTSVVPENLLRFYIHFSAPMSRGDVYQHIGLLDGRDRPVELPFLELGEELWDPAQQRLTLLIDPGRIKRGVKPREEVGTALREGEQFTLVVQATWLDAQNRPLAKAFVKKFRVGPPLQRAIDPAEWQIGAPVQGTREPLTIDFPRPLDQALLGRVISVRHCVGARVDGEIRVSRNECHWELRPTHKWPAGRFDVVVDAALEDLAGNRIGRAFEVDQAETITQQIANDYVRLPFKVR